MWRNGSRTRSQFDRGLSSLQRRAELESLRDSHLDPDVTDVALSLVMRDALPEPIKTHVRSEPSWKH